MVLGLPGLSGCANNYEQSVCTFENSGRLRFVALREEISLHLPTSVVETQPILWDTTVEYKMMLNSLHACACNFMCALGVADLINLTHPDKPGIHLRPDKLISVQVNWLMCREVSHCQAAYRDSLPCHTDCTLKVCTNDNIIPHLYPFLSLITIS